MQINYKNKTKLKKNKKENTLGKDNISNILIDNIKYVKKEWLLYLMLIPFVVWYIVFLYKPMYGLQIGFKDYSIFKGISASPWVGFEHFIRFIKGPYFWRVIRNTLLINVYSIVIGFPIPIILAILFNEIRNVAYRKSIQTLTYLPHFISSVVVVGIITNFLAPTNGLVNLIIEQFGFEKIYFLTKPEWFRTIFITMNIWKGAGFGAIIYLAALSGVDPQLYEAAIIDGANKWKQIWHVTLPTILPTIMIMLILRIGSLLKVGYEQIILLYRPSTYETADVISTYVYRKGIIQGQYDMTTAVGLLNAVVALILVYAANKLSKKLTENSLW